MKRFITLIILLTFISFLNVSFAEIEPNNTYQQASNILPNSSDSGTLNEQTQTTAADNDDYWKITLPVDGSLYFETNSSSNLEIDIYILDIDGNNTIASGTRYGIKEWVSHTYLKAGTYYLRVYRYSGASGSYTIRNIFTAAPYSNDTEPNNTIQTAIQLNVNTEVTGHIRYYQAGIIDYDDYYKIAIPADGSLEVTTETDSAEIDLYLYDVDGNNIIRSATAYGLTERLVFNNLMPGNYYLRVYGYSDHGGYKLKNIFTQTSINGVLTNDVEKNDTYSTAQNLITFNLPGSTYNYGHLGFFTNNYIDYDDYWIVTTTKDGKLIIKTETNSTLDIDLLLYDTDGNTMIKSAYATGENEQLTFDNLGAGKYYIRAYRSNGYGSYKITAEFSTPSMNNDVEPNNKEANAITLSPETIVYGHLGYYSSNFTDNDDYYIFTLATKWDSLYVRIDSDNSLDADLYLMNSSSGTIASAYAVGTKDILKYANAVAGTYYIRAYKSSGQGSYALKLTSKYPGTVISDVEEENIPTQFELFQNYPNPFNPTTTIKYSLPQSEIVRITLYDILGREIKELVNSYKEAGYYNYELNMNEYSSGVYIYQIKAGKYTSTKKLMLVK